MARLGSVLDVLSLLALGGCSDDGGSGDGGLDPHISDPPPAGDASGSAHSGTWDVELYYTSCSGQCSIDTGLGVLTVCDVGDTDSESVEVTQTDGTLRFEADYVAGKQEGTARYWHPNGKLAAMADFRDGLREGEFRTYFEDGTPQTSGTYSNNLKDGRWIVHREDGEIDQDQSGLYEANRRVATLDGTLLSTPPAPNGAGNANQR